MFKANRLAVQLVLTGLVVIVVVGVLWNLADLFLQRQRDQAVALRSIADKIRLDVIQARRREKDFLLRDLKSPTFYEQSSMKILESNSESLRYHAATMASLKRYLKELSSRVSRSELAALSDNVHDYGEIFQTVVHSYHKRGYKDWGLVGQWRRVAHLIEQHAEATENSALKIALLRLRRHEKDYLLRGVEYVTTVQNAITDLRNTIEQTDIPSELVDATERYQQAFDRHVAMMRKIGISDENGLRGQMRSAAREVETAAINLSKRAAIVESDMRNTQLRYNIGVLLLGITLSGIVFHRMASSIVRPLSELREVAIRLDQCDLNARVEINSKNEVGDLAFAFNRLLDRLQQAFEREQRFSDNAAHQLRTPLTIIQGEIDVTLRQSRSPQQYETCLSNIAQVNQEMSQIIDSLLVLSRSTQDETHKHLEPVDLTEWIPEYIQRLHNIERKDDLIWHVEGRIIVMASKPLLAQLLNNLIRNALQYSSPSSKVHIKVTPASRNVEILVRDEGIGIPASEQETVFEPFCRSSVARQMGIAGTGLGLPVARRIAEAFGGTLEYRDESNGSSFVLSLPKQPRISTDA